MTDDIFWLKKIIQLVVIALIVFAIILWLKTPELFEYFNQAFCPH